MQVNYNNNTYKSLTEMAKKCHQGQGVYGKLQGEKHRYA